MSLARRPALNRFFKRSLQLVTLSLLHRVWNITIKLSHHICWKNYRELTSHVPPPGSEKASPKEVCLWEQKLLHCTSTCYGLALQPWHTTCMREIERDRNGFRGQEKKHHSSHLLTEQKALLLIVCSKGLWEPETGFLGDEIILLFSIL